MPFTVATAITRLTSGPINVFKAGLSGAQQLQRINEVLERFYLYGSWRGVTEPIDLTSSSGVITLSTTYLRLDALSVPAGAQGVPIKSQTWAFSPAGPGNQDWTTYGTLLAIDLGDNASGQHRYQLTGTASYLDTLTFKGLARKRFTWISDTATTVVPDNFQALMLGVRALGWMDEGAIDSYNAEWALAMQTLNGDLQEFEPTERQVVIQSGFGAGSIPFVH